MAVAYSSIGTASVDATNDNAAALTISLGAVSEGDYMVAIIGSTETSATPSLTGWTQIANNILGSNIGYTSLFKVATAGDAASPSWTFGVGSDTGSKAGAVIRITGSSFGGAANIIDNDTDDGNSVGSGTETFTGGVTPNANCLLILGAVAGNSGATTFTGASYAIATSNPTWTERADLTDNAGAGTYISLGIATATRPEATPTGNYTVGFDADPGDAIGFILAVQESTNASTTGSVGTLTLATNTTGTVAAGANVTGTVGTLTLTGNAGTSSGGTAKVTNLDKTDTSPTVTNLSKS